MKCFTASLVVGIMLVGCYGLAHATQWHVGVSVSAEYSSATWKLERSSQYTGGALDHRRSRFTPTVSLQVKTTKFNLPWGLEPMFKATYNKPFYDFSDARHPTQTISPSIVNAMIGVNKPFNNDFNVYVLAGIGLMFDLDLKMYEIPVGWHPYRKDPLYKPVINVGVNKLFPVGRWVGLGDKLKAGPEIDVRIYPVQLGFDWCRDFGTGYVVGTFGLVVWF